ncbi:MAG TPA: TlpA disulfide reductase family protein [Terriglobales bacterium]|nr:TlpA disulfide reductase family protein [Terriglobales bacterium]
MTARCPNCSRTLVEVEDFPGLERRFLCDACGGRFRIPAVQVLLFIVLSFIVLVSFSVAVRWIPEGFIDALGFWGMIIASFVGVASVSIMRRLVLRLARFRPLPSSPPQPVSSRDVGFLAALGVQRQLRVVVHYFVPPGAILMLFAYQWWPESKWFAAILLPILIVPAVAKIWNIRCPRCRTRLFNPLVAERDRLRSATACPYCSFVPTADPEIVAAAAPTSRGRVLVAVSYLATVALMVFLVHLDNRIPQLPSIESAPLHLAELDWKFEDLTGQGHHASELLGKPLLLYVWRSSCIPCRVQVAELEKLRSALPEEIAVAGVSTDSPETLQAFAARRSLDLPLYHVDASTHARLDRRGKSTIYLIDSAGQVLLIDTRAAKWSASPVQSYLRALATRDRKTGGKVYPVT